MSAAKAWNSDPVVVTVDSNASAIAIAVRDYGIGMRPGDLARVFDRFWRADPSRQRTFGGTGLGLAIALEDATLHDGELEVWSEFGGGSCFRLTLPREQGERIESSPIELPPDDSAPDDSAPDAGDADDGAADDGAADAADAGAAAAADDGAAHEGARDV